MKDELVHTNTMTKCSSGASPGVVAIICSFDLLMYLLHPL